MFTNFAQKLNGLFGVDGFPPEAAELIISVLTQCNAPLEHRGDVTFDGDVIFNGSTNLGGANYALAVSTWVRASGHGSYVECREAADPIGTPTSDATTFLVYLPRSSQDLDPCVYAGDILQYRTYGGVRYAVGDAYLQETIGTIKHLHHTNIPNGWVAYTDAYSKFIQGASAPAAGGGSSTHTHTGTVTVEEGNADITGTSLSTSASSGTTGSTSLSTLSSSGTTSTEVTDITMAAHPDHRHTGSVGVCRNAAADGSDYYHVNDPGAGSFVTGVQVDVSSVAMDLTHDDLLADPGHEHDIGSHTHTIDPDPHTHTIGSHTHAVSPDPHTHTDDGHDHVATLDLDDANHLPPYIVEVPIIRVGPSGETS